MEFKPEVTSRIPLVRILIAIEAAYRAERVAPVVTSLNDSKHKLGSLHYSDRAADVRTWNIPGQPNPCGVTPGRTCAAIIQRLRNLLGPEYQVFFESDLEGKRVQHIHIEHDPK